MRLVVIKYDMAHPGSLHCPHCQAALSADPTRCPSCGAVLAAPSLFAGRERDLRPDWREWGLPVVTVLWTLLILGSATLVPGAYGWLFVPASVFIAMAILLRWEAIFTVVKFLLAVGIIRGFLIFMAARVAKLPLWMAAGALMMVLSALLIYLVHFHDE